MDFFFIATAILSCIFFKPQEQCRQATASYFTAIGEISRIESLIQEKDSIIEEQTTEINTLKIRVNEGDRNVASANQEKFVLIAELSLTKATLSESEKRLIEVSKEVNTMHTKSMQLTSLPGAPFYDPNTRSAIECPILQSNGHIVPYRTLITQWFQSPNPEDGYIHRTYICSIMRQPTTIASLCTQDRIRSIAKHAGIDTNPPIKFIYSSGHEWIEFSFQDQLSIMAKLCTIQTMQVMESVEHIVVQRNTIAIEINSSLTATVSEPQTMFNRKTLMCFFE